MANNQNHVINKASELLKAHFPGSNYVLMMTDNTSKSLAMHVAIETSEVDEVHSYAESTHRLMTLLLSKIKSATGDDENFEEELEKVLDVPKRILQNMLRYLQENDGKITKDNSGDYQVAAMLHGVVSVLTDAVNPEQRNNTLMSQGLQSLLEVAKSRKSDSPDFTAKTAAIVDRLAKPPLSPADLSELHEQVQRLVK